MRWMWLLIIGLALLLAGCDRPAAAQVAPRAAPAVVATQAPTSSPAAVPSATPAPTRARPAITPDPAPAPESAGASIRLAVGATSPVAAGGPALRFLGVVEDSRCPLDATCIWAGRALVQLAVTSAGQPPQVITLGLPGVTPDAPTSQAVGAYTVTIIDLEPFPALSAPVPADAYLLTLSVAPGAAPLAGPNGG